MTVLVAPTAPVLNEAQIRASERDRCIAAIRVVQQEYDKMNAVGPNVEASVCSDCIGAINAIADKA